jgi:hypothetical protein
VAQSKEYFESTDLAMRVRSWHERIAPKLEAVEKRGDFDIHNYGSKIIDRFGVGNEGAVKARKTSYNFKELVVGKTQEEACRIFLSVLMLANTLNVDIKPIKSHPDELMPMDNVELTLISRRRQMEQLRDYQAPSQESLHGTSPSSSGSKHQRRVDDRHDSRNGDLNPTLATISEEDDDRAPDVAAVVDGNARGEPGPSREGSVDLEL